jgi:hypothetical protein
VAVLLPTFLLPPTLLVLLATSTLTAHRLTPQKARPASILPSAIEKVASGRCGVLKIGPLPTTKNALSSRVTYRNPEVYFFNMRARNSSSVGSAWGMFRSVGPAAGGAVGASMKGLLSA